MRQFTWKQYLSYFLIYSIGMFLFYKFYMKLDLVTNAIITIITGILATLLSFWIASKQKPKE